MKPTVIAALILVSILASLSTACSQEQPAAPVEQGKPGNTPGLVTSTPLEGSTTPASTAESSGTTNQPNPTAAQAVPTPTITPVLLEVFTPIDGSVLEIGSVRVMGTTSGTSINIAGRPTEVNQNGHFERDLELDPGENSIEVMASDAAGVRASRIVTVSVIEQVEGLPLTVLYPPDGFQATGPRLDLVGVTRPDAGIGVNGNPVDVNEFGVFSTPVELEPGGNVLEVAGADIEGNMQSQIVTVFFLQ